MTSGKEHENATKLWSIPFGLLLLILAGPKNAFLGTFAFLFGGLWLSPDLDTYSKPLKRWGIFKGLWWPYRKFIPHRSLLSHGPFIGTLLRVIYLITFCILITLVLQSFGVIQTLNIMKIIFEKLIENSKTTISILVGLEASAWLHLIKDGDPMPKKLAIWKRR